MPGAALGVVGAPVAGLVPEGGFGVDPRDVFRTLGAKPEPVTAVAACTAGVAAVGVVGLGRGAGLCTAGETLLVEEPFEGDAAVTVLAAASFVGAAFGDAATGAADRATGVLTASPVAATTALVAGAALFAGAASRVLANGVLVSVLRAGELVLVLVLVVAGTLAEAAGLTLKDRAYDKCAGLDT